LKNSRKNLLDGESVKKKSTLAVMLEGVNERANFSDLFPEQAGPD